MHLPDSDPRPISLPRLGSAFLLQGLRALSAELAFLVPIPKNLEIWQNLEMGSCLPLSEKPSPFRPSVIPSLSGKTRKIYPAFFRNPTDYPYPIRLIRLIRLFFFAPPFSTFSPRLNGILSKTHQHLPRHTTPYHFITEHPAPPSPHA